MSKNIRAVNSMKNGPKRQASIKNLTKKVPSKGKSGKPLATLPSNSSVRKGKESGGKGGASAGKPNVAKSNASSKSVTGKPMGAGGPIRTMASSGSVKKGKMNNGGKARRVT